MLIQNSNMSKPSISPETGDHNATGHHVLSDKNIRREVFIRKVYSILAAQLAATGLSILFQRSVLSSLQSAAENQSVLVTFLIQASCLISVIFMFGWAVSMIALGWEFMARKTSINYILLFIFTIGQGCIIGSRSADFSAEQILLAVGITVLICFLSTVFAFRTKIDFTKYHTILVLLQCVLGISGVFYFFVPDNESLRIFHLFGGVFVFPLLLISDTQLMIAGDHKYALSLEDYVFAAMWIYMDIISVPFCVVPIYPGCFRKEQKKLNVTLQIILMATEDKENGTKQTDLIYEDEYDSEGWMNLNIQILSVTEPKLE